MSRSKKKNLLKATLPDDATDQARIDTMQNIVSMAPQSPLYTQNAKVKSAVDDAGQKASTLKTQVTTANTLKLQWEQAVEEVIATRNQLGTARTLLRSTLESNATSLADLASLGVGGYIGAVPPTPVTPPTGVKVDLGKVHGQFRATAISPVKGPKFGAQISADPIGPTTWIDLPGNGKRRLITGHASGSLVWVRFRVVRGHTTSDWSAPMSVTVP